MSEQPTARYAAPVLPPISIRLGCIVGVREVVEVIFILSEGQK